MGERLVELCNGIETLIEWARELKALGESAQADRVWAQIGELLKLASAMPIETRQGLLAKTKCLSASLNVHEGRLGHVAVQSLETDVARFAAERNARRN